MDDLTLVTLGFTAGFAVPVFGWMVWDILRQNYQRYCDQQIREAKQELREYARDHGGRDR